MNNETRLDCGPVYRKGTSSIVCDNCLFYIATIREGFKKKGKKKPSLTLLFELFVLGKKAPFGGLSVIVSSVRI